MEEGRKTTRSSELHETHGISAFKPIKFKWQDNVLWEPSSTISSEDIP